MIKSAEKENPFKKAYSSLNLEQKKAVDAIEGPVMVIAGPGTGKTTILTLRIANILDKTDTPASSILAITYTDAGAKAMRAKLKDIIGSRAYDVHIHTFHGFAKTIMDEFFDHFLHLQNFRQTTDIERESLIRSILLEPKYSNLRPLGRPDTYISGILGSISQAKRDAESPSGIRDFAEEEIGRIEKDEQSISTRGASKGKLKADAEKRIQKCQKTILMADIYEEYEKAKRERKLMDFDDLIIELLIALQNDELLKRLVQEKFFYILVDEHQDTNDSQNLIIKIIAEFFETPNVFIVGDEKQAIYRFQGASVDNFLSLQKLWPDLKIISLDTNYRSHQHILDASFSMIENNYEAGEYQDLRVQLKSGKNESPKPIELVEAENIVAMEKYLIDQVKELQAKNPEASIALITRRNREIDKIINLFERENVPLSSERAVDIFTHPIGRIFFNILEYLDDLTRVDTIARTMIDGCWNLSLEETVSIIKDLRSGREADLENRLTGLKKINNERHRSSALGFLILIAEESSLIDLISKDPTGTQVWRGIMTLSESLIREQNLNDPSELIKVLLSYRQSAENKTVKVSIGAPDSKLVALTAHGSKGLEFDYVFLPYATEDAWVGKKRGGSFVLPRKAADSSDIADLRRLFYVALTRARRHVTILYQKEELDGKNKTPLRFLEEIYEDTLSYTKLPRVDLALPEKIEKEGDLTNHPITNLAKKKLLQSGLSVTALNHFLEDPEKFLLESVLQLPQAPVPIAEKGTAMHLAMDRVWKLEDKSSAKIEKTINKAVSDHLINSLLTVNEKEVITSELQEAAPLIANDLQQHFKHSGVIFTEYWMEAGIPVELNGETIEIPIHGKLDALISNDSTIEIFDYKTKQGMSEAAIRGETASEDGRYFRQLIFYHMLAAADLRFKDKKIETSLVFISPDKKGRCPIKTLPITEEDVAKLKERVAELVEFVWSGKLARLTEK